MGYLDMTNILPVFLLITSYCIIGSIIKFLDDIYDRNRQFSGRAFICWGFSALVIILLDIWISLDVYTALLTLSLAIGLMIAQKVDNHQFLAIALFTLPVAIFFIFQTGLLLLIPPMLIALTPSAALDELIHGRAQQFTFFPLLWLAHRRPLMKIVVLVLPFFGLFTFFHAMAFWGFDITYELVAYWLRLKSKKP
jgi:hypothetical protein